MENFINIFIDVLISTIKDVTPILILLIFFQFVILKQPLPNPKRTITGFIYVILGLVLFLIGLEKALFPLGEIMATQLTDPKFIATISNSAEISWKSYYWVYIFAFAIGFSTTIAEPSLIAVAGKAGSLSGGALSPIGLRVAVAFGVAISIALGTFRIVTGTPLYLYMIAGYIFVIIQTIFAPKLLIPLAYDSGGVTTSTVTVPLVTALGLGLASTIPDRSALIDGFGLIALASLFPMITVMGYAQIANIIAKKKHNLRGEK